MKPEEKTLFATFLETHPNFLTVANWLEGPDPPATLPADFFIKQDAALAEGNRIKNLKGDNSSNAIVAGIVGLYGFAGGFALWILYRLIRFAVKG